jgi:pilus assembly protein CpaE
VQHVLVVGTDRKLEAMLERTGRAVAVVPASEVAGRKVKARVVIIDARGWEHLSPFVSALTREWPGTGFILLSAKLDPVLMLEGMRAGIRECVAEPLTADELNAAIDRVAVTEHEAAGSVFAFVGAKGGVGTTTAAVNVALELASVAPKRTLLIDLHLSNGDAAVFLAEEPRFTLADAIDNAHRLDEAFLRSLVLRTKSNLDLLASPDSGTGGSADAGRIRTLIGFAATHYRFTVLDVPRSEPSVLDALQAAERIVIVGNQELATVRRASRMAAMLRQRYGKERLALAIARYDPRSEIGQDDIERAVGAKVRWVLPSDYRRAVEALNTGKPLSLGNHNRLAASFKSLALDLVGLPPENVSGTSSSGLFARMRGRRSS